MKKNDPRLAAIVLFTISISLFATSLFLPACQPLTNGSPGEKWHGFELFVIGPLGFLAFHFSWLGNALLFISWINVHQGRRGPAAVFAVAALATASSFVLYETIPVGSSGAFPFRVLLGYYVWLAAMFAALLSALVMKSEVEQDTVFANDEMKRVS